FSGGQTLQQRSPARPAQPPVPAATPKQDAVELPKGTSLQVEIARNCPMKAGEAVEGRLLHPIYANGKLVVAENTALHGKVVALEPDSKTRLKARLRGDFTPFHKPAVQFDGLMLPDGPVPIAASATTDGAPVLHLSTPGASPKQSFIQKRWAEARNNLHDRIAYFTAPGKVGCPIICTSEIVSVARKVS
ncbi:MAG TPA: hypothetical protein VM912_07070, partial [Terriglobales bacterium]|nr:hypothetical protein [Terriglobales bacterium]